MINSIQQSNITMNTQSHVSAIETKHSIDELGLFTTTKLDDSAGFDTEKLQEYLDDYNKNANNITDDEMKEYAKKEAEISAIEEELNKRNAYSQALRLTSYDSRKQAEEIYYSQHPEAKNDELDSKMKNLENEHSDYMAQKEAQYRKEHPFNGTAFDVNYPAQYEKELSEYLSQCEKEYMANNQDYARYSGIKITTQFSYISNDDNKDHASDDIDNYNKEQTQKFFEPVENFIQKGVDFLKGLFE